MTALKIRSEAVTASFRYPRVQVGMLPTFDMPPPATIYGHLAGVLGDWFDPDDLSFSYVFEHDGRASDIETGHPIERGSGRLGLKNRGWAFPINVHCTPNPQRRDFLLHPRMTLYLSSRSNLLDRLQAAFLSPAWSYVLGRSQDLATVLSVELAGLIESAEAAFSDTLLPFDWRPHVLSGSTVLLPCAIDYTSSRQPRFERYLQVTQPPMGVFSGSKDTINRPALPSRFWVDPSDQLTLGGRDLGRGLVFFPVLSR